MAADSATAIKILTDLKNAKSDESKQRFARRLREWVQVESKGGTDANFSAVMNTLYNKIFDLVNSADPSDKMSGIFAIHELTEEPVPDNETKIVRFANYLRGVPPSSTDPAVLRLASKALGHLARAGGTMTTDFVEYEAKRALEWLQSIDPRNEARKLAAVLILRELAENAPTLFYPQLATFFTHIWAALSDPRQHIRECAARALSSCLTLVTKRYSKDRDKWYGTLYKAARTALVGGGSLTSLGSNNTTTAGRTSNDIVHGALLTLGELLNNELAHDVMLAPGEKYLLPKFNEMCEMVLKYRDSKEKLIRRTVIVLLPRLAYYSPEAFVRGYAEVALAHLLACLRDTKQAAERGTAFVVVGRIALAVGAHLSADALRPQLERIVAVVREALSAGAPVSSTAANARGGRRPFVQEALNCVGMLAKAVGPALMEFMHDLLDPMFSDGLSLMLTEALQCTANAIPALKPLLQERLLHEVSLILANRPFVPPYAEPLTHAQFPFAGADPTGLGAGDPSFSTSLGAPANGAAGAMVGAFLDAPNPSTPWTGYNLLSGSTLASLSARQVASNAGTSSVHAGGAPGQGFLSSLLSSANTASASMNVGSNTLVGGNLGLSLSTPATMSWARNLPSSVAGGPDASGSNVPGLSNAGSSLGAGSSNELASPVVLANARGIPKDLSCLSLHILGTFDFTGVPLLPFVREVVVMYLDDDDPIIRLEAGLTCCRLMARPTDIIGKEVDPIVQNSGFDTLTDDFGGDGESDNDESPLKGGHDPLDEGDGATAFLPASEIVRHRKVHALHRRFLEKLRPPQHPLLVYGMDMMSAGIGMGNHTSPVAMAMSGYSGGFTEAVAGGEDHNISSLLGTVGAGPTLAIVTQLLERILVMAVTDTDPAIRFEMLASLDRRFDMLLVDPSNLRILFLGLQDENYACREAVLALLGRLTAHNPSAILPMMRDTLLSILAELENADAHPDVSALSRHASTSRGAMLRTGGRAAEGDIFSGGSGTLGTGIASTATAAARIAAYHNGSSIILTTMRSGGGRDHAARMLGLLLRAAQRLIAPYVPVVLRALLPHAWGTSAARPLLVGDTNAPIPTSAHHLLGIAHPDVLSGSILAAIGELSAVGADHILPYINMIVPLVVDAVTQGAHMLGIGPGVAASRAAISADGTQDNSPAAPSRNIGSHAPLNFTPTSVYAFSNPISFTEVAIRTLGLLVENTGHVIIPYLDHPHLMQILITMVARGPLTVSTSRSLSSRTSRAADRAGIAPTATSGSHWPLRREAMRALGVLGALDPYRHRMAQIAQAQRAAVAVQLAVQAKLAASVAAARAKGRRLAAAGLDPSVLNTGVRPGAGLPFSSIDDLAEVKDVDGPLVMASGVNNVSAWDLQKNLPMIIGIAVGGGMDIDPMEAAMAGLAGEPGANVGINLDEVGVDVGNAVTGNALLGPGIGMDGILQAGPAGGIAGLGLDIITADGEGKGAAYRDAAGVVNNVAASAILPSMVNPSEDFYPTVGLMALLNILSDDALSLHHNSALQIIMLIVKSLGSRCVSFLPRVVPTFLTVLHVSAAKARAQPAQPGSRVTSQVTGDGISSLSASTTTDTSMGSSILGAVDTNATLRDTVLQQLAALISLVKHNIRPWLPSIFALIREVWPASLPSLLRLVETTAAALGEECKPYLSTVIPHMLSILAHDGTKPVFAPTPSVISVFQDGSSAATTSYSSVDRGGAASLPGSARTNTRHVLHTIAVLVCGGRRALWGGHRHLIDDHFDLLVPAICRLIDAGVVINAATDDEGGQMLNGSTLGAASSVGWWSSASGIPSNSSSLNGYGAVAPVVRRQALDTLAAMAAAGVNLTRFASRIIHPVGRTLADTSGYTSLEIKRTAVDLLCLLALQLRDDFIIWVPTVRKACMLATLGANSSDAMAVNPTGGTSSNLGGTHSSFVGDGVDAFRSGSAVMGIGSGGVSGTGPGSAIRHETYERLVALLLGFGSGYGYLGDDSLALYGYGPPLPLPINPVELAELLYDPGTCSADGSGVRIASALALGNMGNMISVATPAFGGTVLDGGGGAAGPIGGVPGLLGHIATENETFGLGITLPGGNITLAVAGPDGMKKLPVNQEMLKRAWETNARSTREDWSEWMRRFAVELLRESPSPALRSCCALAQVYSPLASDLFNAAFVAVWSELYDENQDSLMQALEAAFASETIPTYILQALLNLAEFMEHDEKALPIDVRLLGQLAEKVGAYAKALHYKEMQFHTDPASCIEAIISINNQLDQPEAAVGILKYAQQAAHGYGQYGYRSSHMSIAADSSQSGDRSNLFGFGVGLDVQETWYEKLGRWDDALEAYERKQTENPNSLSLVLGRMRCLKALGEWQRLDALSRDAWPRLMGNEVGLRAVAPLAARAAWALGKWDEMEVYAGKTDEYSMQGAFFRAVLGIHRLSHDVAQRYIDRARKVLSAEFSAMGSESYGRTYRKMVTVQQLSEMEEILTYLKLQGAGNAPGAQTYISHVRNMWASRLRGCGRNVDVWNRILSVRSLVVVASENMSEWLQFASLCRRSGRMNMALKVLMGLGMDGGGGLRDTLARYLTGKGSVHAFDASTSVLPVTSPFSRMPSRPAAVDESFNPMLLPDHPYRPYQYDYRTNHTQMLEASSRVGSESAAHPKVVYAYLKHLWHSGHRETAIDQLKYLVQTLDDHAARRLRQQMGSAESVTGTELVECGIYGEHKLSAGEEQSLRVQCHLRLGQWQETMIEPIVSNFGAAYGHSVAMRKGNGSPLKEGEDGIGPRIQRALSRATSTGSGVSANIGGSSLSGLRPANRMPSDTYSQLITPIMSAFKTATHECGDSGFSHYRAWHAWAISNFAAAEYHAENAKHERDRERQRSPTVSHPVNATTMGSAKRLSQVSPNPGLTMPQPPSITVPPPPSVFAMNQAVVAHAVAAVKGFFRSIALGRTRLKAYVLQDLLRLLTLWFSHGDAPAVRAALEAGLHSGAVSIEVWLQVIPQLIARINIRTPAVHKLLQALLDQIGQAHPQALVYPLTVACKSASSDRRAAASQILGHMRRRWAKLVDQADMVSRELIRVAILWHEMWHSGLEEASRLYFGEGNVAGMLTTLLPLHEMMRTPGAQTVKEVAFSQMFGTELETAHQWLLAYKQTGQVGDLSQAWDIYYHVFRKINKMLPTYTSLDLPSVSPILLAAHDLELSVPGTYHAGSPVVRIMAFSPSIDVLPSKQRPRKVTLLGSNGRQYTFLLKGHEDLRQDERVMQLFGLVNTLLANDTETSRRDLSIRRYAVTPLSHDAGVVGWVPNCDTLHALIREFRDTRKILLNIEHRLMVQMAPMYDNLTVLQKVEVFRFALDNTTGQDLYKVLWLKSSSSEVWLERRTNYTRSLAVMSIVGYVLGLGDRHPSNLMLDRVSGKILHIDFGDCFEVAMTRDKMPERVPFRLTRMLVNAMEVSGIEGNYRSVCEAVMRVLRQHRDSVMAMLEAFVHDPLINWRLLNTNTDPTQTGGGAAPTVVPAAPTGGPRLAVPTKLTDNEAMAKTLVQQGLAFQAEAEAAVLANVLAETGFGAVPTGDSHHDAIESAALARSLAVSLHTGRGDRERELVQALGPEGAAAPTEAVNERAVAVIRRIQAKLTGRDFAEDDPLGRMMSVGIGLLGGLGQSAVPDGSGTLDIAAQVQRLICAATSHENLSQSYIGWCPFW